MLQENIALKRWELISDRLAPELQSADILMLLIIIWTDKIGRQGLKFAIHLPSLAHLWSMDYWKAPVQIQLVMSASLFSLSLGGSNSSNIWGGKGFIEKGSKLSEWVSEHIK